MQTISNSFTHANPLRDSITNAYRMDETTCLRTLIQEATLPLEARSHVTEIAKKLVTTARLAIKQQSKIDTLLHQYDLSSEEGIALMCLAEALLRIPDKATMDKFIGDKLGTANWKNHLSSENSLFVNAATWSLLLTGKIYAPTLTSEQDLMSSIKRAGSRLGISVIRPLILNMMKAIGKQFVMGEDIHSALRRAETLEKKGYTFSYDMLGEAARTAMDAEIYYQAYTKAILAIGEVAKKENITKNPGISIKLSALHPRYEFSKYETVVTEVSEKLLALALLAKKFNIGLNVDAEEADKLDLSLDIFENVFINPALSAWDGFGLALQAYQKRAFYVLDWLIALAKEHHKKIMVRLVKGAYWDAEIKMTEVQGLNDYPVFTRKNSTDVSYLACARKMLANPQCFYAQFATHNAYSIAAIMEMAKGRDDFEFQCLHGMGEPMYDQIIDQAKYDLPCRIYAPVGTHQDLLGYLVRRLLENGANSSFINQLADEKTPIDKFVYDPVERIAKLAYKPHPRIPKPKDIYHDWENSRGIDLSNRIEFATLKAQMAQAAKEEVHAGSIVKGQVFVDNNSKPVIAPADHNDLVGTVNEAHEETIDSALKGANAAKKSWGETSVTKRAAILEHAADLFQQAMPALVSLLSREGGRCLVDCISEVRETIDYCRYYAFRARRDFCTKELPGPTGEANQLSLHPRGVIACISPWNFPLAIFTGQIVAALAAGNTVIAKPAEQTPLIAFKAIQLLHQAGIPKDVLYLLLGRGEVVGAKLISDPLIDGVMFTGSTETAKFIEQKLAKREGQIVPFIAETGGQNAMIVDSSALAEQTVIDIVQSAFNSAGQRCSALRVLFIQEEASPKLLSMLKGYMAELTIGDPRLLATDVGPIIDADARKMLEAHVDEMKRKGKFFAEAPLADDKNGNFFAPCAFEINDLSLLKREVFGPILHIIRYPARDLDKVMDAIINTGYGLTLGIQSRIDTTIEYIASRMPVGNVYVNRNMIGAVVGVQPFGGERLSGTGPKAGGPYYLPRLCVERSRSTNTTAVGGNARLVSLLEEDE